jgi:hypothetical protein
MQQLFFQIIIALVIAGFLFYAVDSIVAAVPLRAEFKVLLHTLITIAAVAIIIFYVVIPLLNLLAGVHIPVPSLH